MTSGGKPWKLRSEIMIVPWLFRPLPSPPSAAQRLPCALLPRRRGLLPPAAIMISYWDLVSHDEMFSGIYKIREIADGLCLEVEAKTVSRTEGSIDDSLIGGNASAEGPEGEGTESTVMPGVDIVMNHLLQETSFTKEAYKKYIKDYMKSTEGKLEEQKPERVKFFMTGVAEQIKHILTHFNNCQFVIGENMNPDGMVALLDPIYDFLLTNSVIALDLPPVVITGCCFSSTPQQNLDELMPS
nr:translationally-controlled tumor protein-like [Dasypus novemcinctus]